MTTRICVVGCSGAGKTTLARELAKARGAEHIELDGLFHGAGWTPTPTDDLRARLKDRLEAAQRVGGWVVDGNYIRHVGDLTLEVADTVVLLDLPRATVMRQVVLRTAQRLALRQELWNGNRERLREVLARDPERSIVGWAWTQHARYSAEFGELRAKAPQKWVVVRDRRQTATVLARLSTT